MNDVYFFVPPANVVFTATAVDTSFSVPAANTTFTVPGR